MHVCTCDGGCQGARGPHVSVFAMCCTLSQHAYNIELSHAKAQEEPRKALVIAK
jgi:hypothetical protein